MRTIRIKLYKFSELSDQAKKNALKSHKDYKNIKTGSDLADVFFDLDKHEFTKDGKQH